MCNEKPGQAARHDVPPVPLVPLAPVTVAARSATARGGLESESGPQKTERETDMLVTFKCHASPDVTMLENLAQYLLGIIGKRLGPRGVITHEELDTAISKLEAAIATDKKERAEHEGHFHEGEEGHDHHELPPGLAQRAFPFLDMLRLAKQEDNDVLWGV